VRKLLFLSVLAVITQTAFGQNCPPVSAPYLEDFDNVFAPDVPECLSVEDGDGDGYTWFTYDLGNQAPSPSNILLHIAPPSSSPDDWMFTNGINMVTGDVYEVNFQYAVNHMYGQNLEINIGNAPNSGSMSVAPIFSEYFVDSFEFIPATAQYTATNTGVKYFGFHIYGSISNDGFLLDDLTINKISSAPTCDTAKHLTAAVITPTSVNITWDQQSIATGYVYVLNESSATPVGSGTLITTPSFTIGGLKPGTQYYFHVKPICGNDNAAWTKLKFSTNPTDVQVLAGGDGIEVYPNPATDKLTISGKNVRNLSGITLTDLLGRKLKTAAIAGDKTIIDLTGLNAGVYLVQCTNGAEKQIIKVVKQ
jgi:hypothetical protein